MDARTKIFEDAQANTQADDLRVTYYDTTKKGDRYRVANKNATGVNGYFYVDDAGTITPDMPTRAARSPVWKRAAKTAIRQLLIDEEEQKKEEQGYAFLVTIDELQVIEWDAEFAAALEDDDEIDDVTLISW